MNRLIGIASAMLLALLFVVPITLAADPVARGERIIIASGTDLTLAPDQSVEMVVVYNATARIEGHASTILVVQGTANLVGGHADGIIAIQSQVSLDPASHVSGDIRTVDSPVAGDLATTVAGGVRDFGPDMILGWRNLGAALALIYIAFAVSALIAGVILAGLASRQVRAAGALITKEPAMVVGAAFLGLIGLITAGVVAIVTVVGIPSGVGLLALVLPAMFVIGYIVAGIWVGEWILSQSSPLVRDRPYLAAVIGLSLVGLVSFLPPVGGLISFVGFGSIVLLSWRVFRAVPGAAQVALVLEPVPETPS